MRNFSLYLKRFPWLIPVLIFSLLIIGGALAHPLWADEAETAFFAKTILQTGLPKGFDGTNVTAIQDGITLNRDLLNHRSPWLQYYLTALSFLVLGQSSFSARLPFIIMSLFTPLLLYLLAYKIAENRPTALITSIIACLSVPLILFSFQDRYFSLVIFSSLAMALTSFSLYHQPRSPHIWPKLGFVLSSLLFAFAHYASFPFFYAGLFFAQTAMILLAKKPRKLIVYFIIQYLLTGLIVSLIIGSWLFVLKPGSDGLTHFVFSLDTAAMTVPSWIVTNLGYFNNNGVFPYILWLAALIILAIKIYKKQDVKPILFVLVLIFSYILLFAVFDSTTATASGEVINTKSDSIEVVVNQSFVDSRYHTALIPLLIILASLIFYELRKINRSVFIGALSIYIATNWLSLSSPRYLVWDYINEIANPYQVSDQLVANYLKQNAKDDDTAFVSSDRAYEPIMFLLGNKRIKFINRLNPLNRRLFPKNFKKIAQVYL